MIRLYPIVLNIPNQINYKAWDNSKNDNRKSRPPHSNPKTVTIKTNYSNRGMNCESVTKNVKRQQLKIELGVQIIFETQ